MAAPAAARSASDSVALLMFFVFWYAGNVKYNEYNNGALVAAGGKNAGYTMIISTAQLAVCSIYAVVIWIIGINPIRLCGFKAPAKQSIPKLSPSDMLKTIPVGVCSAGAHSSSVFALGGDPLFGQIVKAGEPVISSIVAILYGNMPGLKEMICLPIIVGGVGFASLKKGADGAYALKFDQTALVFGMIANMFAAFKGTENKKLMVTAGLKDRFGGVGNQFAVTEILAFLVSLPIMFYTEGDKFPAFVELFKSSPALQWNLVMSGFTFYIYNELATMTVKETGPVTSSVANTAKRVIVMLYMAAVTGKALTDEQKIGAGVAIGGVLFYSVFNDMFAKKSKKKKV